MSEQPHITIHEAIKHPKSNSTRTIELYHELYSQSINNPSKFWGGYFYLFFFRYFYSYFLILIYLFILDMGRKYVTWFQPFFEEVFYYFIYCLFCLF